LLIALGVGGGIAAYKACEIVRALDRANVGVQVLLTRNATRFITPLTLQTLSRRKVLVEPFDLDDERTVTHIELTRSIAAFVVAPATANLLAKFSRGIADDLVSTFYTCVTAPVLVAPAMNTRMLLHPATQENLALLAAHGVRVIDPESGWLAEGEVGWGRMADPARIAEAAIDAASCSRQLAGRSVVVTAGPTRERIDPVRFLSNRSSGKMGYALAAAAAQRGARVTLISGPVNLAPPFGVECIAVETSEQMREEVLRASQGAAAVFMVAAVSDYAPRAVAASKIKRSGSPLTLTLDEGPDILAELGRERRDGDGRLLVGFAAETEDLLDNARAKLERKNVDFLVANDVSRSDIGLDSDHNEVTILARDGRSWEIPRAGKAEVARAILDRVLEGLLPEARE
jgi:phosphopantothenoylcysteine decarboxylase/phosphopantothenate--cysteine ligase